MRLQAATLIEGIVSMVILSILLSIAILIVFNLYRSYPSVRHLEMESLVNRQLDSLTGLEIREDVSFSLGRYQVDYEVSDFENFENVKVAECVVIDSVGYSQVKRKIFYVPGED